ncbi:tyrosine-type recombinase/integrase [Peribacillus sp. YIM B13481]
MKQRLVYEDQDFIFAENIGHPRVMKQVVLRLQRLMKHWDVDKHITPHSFRHTHTSLFIDVGAGIKEIQEILGHSDINTPMIFHKARPYTKKLDPKGTLYAFWVSSFSHYFISFATGFERSNSTIPKPIVTKPITLKISR